MFTYDGYVVYVVIVQYKTCSKRTKKPFPMHAGLFGIARLNRGGLLHGDHKTNCRVLLLTRRTLLLLLLCLNVRTKDWRVRTNNIRRIPPR